MGSSIFCNVSISSIWRFGLFHGPMDVDEAHKNIRKILDSSKQIFLTEMSEFSLHLVVVGVALLLFLLLD